MAREFLTDDLLINAAQRAARYLATIGDRPVSPAPGAVERLADLEEPFPDGPSDPAAVLALLDEVVSPATMAMAGPRFFGFVIGGALPAALAAGVLAGAWDQNTAKAAVTPGTAKLEEVALRWILEALSLPSGAAGAFVTGATMANRGAASGPGVRRPQPRELGPRRGPRLMPSLGLADRRHGSRPRATRRPARAGRAPGCARRYQRAL